MWNGSSFIDFCFWFTCLRQAKYFSKPFQEFNLWPFSHEFLLKAWRVKELRSILIAVVAQHSFNTHFRVGHIYITHIQKIYKPELISRRGLKTHTNRAYAQVHSHECWAGILIPAAVSERVWFILVLSIILVSTEIYFLLTRKKVIIWRNYSHLISWHWERVPSLTLFSHELC